MFENILPYTGLLLYDVKFVTPEKQLAATGVGNDKILGNLKKLCQRGARVWVRVPLVPDFHDLDEIKKIAAFLKDLPLERIELIPYHRYGVGKYTALGIPYTVSCKEPDAQWMKDAAACFGVNFASLLLAEIVSMFSTPFLIFGRKRFQG